MATNQQSITEDRASGAQVIEGSSSFNVTLGTYIARTPSSGGNRKTWTWSCWLKRTSFDTRNFIFAGGNTSNAVDTFHIEFNNDNIRVEAFTGSTNPCQITSNAVYRDTAWYHIVLAVDTTQGTNSQRIKVYVNGEAVTWASTTWPDQDYLTGVNSTQNQTIGIDPDTLTTNEFGGYITECNLLDGYALDASYFGFTDPLTGTWRPKKYDGSFNAPIDGWDVTTWSSYVSGSVDGSYPLSNCFTAPIGSGYANGTRSTNPGSLTLNISALNLTVTNVRLNVYIYGSPTLTVNGSSVPITGTDDQEFVVAVDGQLNTVVWSYDSVTVYCYMRGIEVDLGDGAGYRLLADASGAPAGVNGFRLPLDGSALIGSDQSGNGNDWTPTHMGSASLDKATSALPILNTSSGGNVAVPGVRGQAGIAVTVYNPTGSQNRYYFDGVEAPSYNFARGQTVTFDLGDTTVATHQLKFSTTSDGTHGGGSAYDDGAAYGAISAGTVGAATTITFPHNAENTLYYYCVNHSGMGGSVGLTTNVQKADPYAWKNILAAPLDYSAIDYSNLVNCTATARTLTVDGPAAGSESNFYNKSYYWDGSNDKITAPNSADFNLKSAGWTAECWARPQDDSDQVDLITYMTTTTGWYMFIDSNMKFGCGWQVSGGSYQEILSPANAVNWDQWQHFAAVCDSGTVKLYLNGILQPDTEATSGDSQDPGGGTLGIGWKGGSYPDWLKGNIQDVRIYHVCKYTENFIPASTNPDIFLDTPSGVAYGSNLTKVTDGSVHFDNSGDSLTVADNADFDLGTNSFTIECFAYLETIGQFNNIFAVGTDSSNGYRVDISTSNNLRLLAEIGGSWSTVITGGTALTSNKWYHLVVTRSGNDFDLWVDGIKDTTTVSNSGTITDPTTQLEIGRLTTNSLDRNYHGFISNLRFVNGTAIYTGKFTPPTAPLTNVTNTKLLCCQSPTSATTAAVTPGTITANGQAAATIANPFDTDIDTVQGKSTGYPTMNPLAKNSSIVLEDGNLLITSTGSHGDKKIVHSTAKIPNDGKWYVEWNIGGPGCTLGFGLGGNVNWRGSDTQLGEDTNSWGYEPNGNLFHNGNLGGSYPAASGGEAIGMTIDTSGSTVTAQWYQDGVLIRNSSDTAAEFTGIARSDYIVMMSQHSPLYDTRVNFGQNPFKFPPPDGFQPLNSANLETSTSPFARPSDAMAVVKWTGDGTSPRKIEDFDFPPDLVVYKQSGEARDWQWYDTVRGVGPAKNLTSNVDYAQTANDDTQYGYTSAFNHNGFTLTNGSSGSYPNIYTNKSGGGTYVSYCWKAGGNKNTFNINGVGYATAAAAGLTGGDITPTGASINTKSGFSIISYVGTGNDGDTVAHGLTKEPAFVIVKKFEEPGNWGVYHQGLSANTKVLTLNTTIAELTPTDKFFTWSSTTTDLLGLGFNSITNDNTEGTVAYLWADIPGLQKFGSYIGNGNSDGSYVELGFRPALVIVKKISDTGNWMTFDNQRGTYNVNDNSYYVNLSNANVHDDGNGMDFLANGFKCRGNLDDANQNNATYVYCAWAETPFHNMYGAEGVGR